MSSLFWKNHNKLNLLVFSLTETAETAEKIIHYWFLGPFSAEAELRFLGFVPARLAWARDSGQAEAVKKIKSVMLILPAP